MESKVPTRGERGLGRADRRRERPWSTGRSGAGDGCKLCEVLRCGGADRHKDDQGGAERQAVTRLPDTFDGGLEEAGGWVSRGLDRRAFAGSLGGLGGRRSGTGGLGEHDSRLINQSINQ